MVQAWRQMLNEAGEYIPDRNIERLLRETHVPVPANDNRRLDLIVPGLNILQGLPLFCDVTIISPMRRTGMPRPSTSNRGGGLLERAERENNQTYDDVIATGLGSLQCLGSEVYGRWGAQSVQLVPALARERCRFLHARIRRGTQLGLLHRWWGILGVTLQRCVGHIVLQEFSDIPTLRPEPACPLDELQVL